MNIYIYVYMIHICIYIYLYSYINTNISMYIQIYMYTYSSLYTYIYIYVYIHIESICRSCFLKIMQIWRLELLPGPRPGRLARGWRGHITRWAGIEACFSPGLNFARLNYQNYRKYQFLWQWHFLVVSIMVSSHSGDIIFL